MSLVPCEPTGSRFFTPVSLPISNPTKVYVIRPKGLTPESCKRFSHSVTLCHCLSLSAWVSLLS
jgi:hypothetical protein